MFKEYKQLRKEIQGLAGGMVGKDTGVPHGQLQYKSWDLVACFLTLPFSLWSN